MTFADIFSGIGGFRLGLERAGFECRWACEIDSFCRKVYLKHWPDTKPFYKNIYDITNPPKVDLICGGFPCQPVSFAGKRKGESDARWLWPQLSRIISEIRPQFVLLENVAGLLSKGFPIILSDLAKIGYDAEWDCIPASIFGAPHKRNRIWIIAYPKRSEQSWEKSCSREIGRMGRPIKSVSWDRNWKEALCEFRRMDDGLSYKVDRVDSIRNAVVPQVVEYIGNSIKNIRPTL